MPFSGLAGFLIVSLMAVGAVAAYVALYCYHHYITGRDERPLKVFTFDVSKILISQSGAWIVNLVMTELVVQEAARALGARQSEDIEGIAWYASIFLLDCLVGVPLGIVLGKLFTLCCRCYLRQRRPGLGASWSQNDAQLRSIHSVSALDLSLFFDESGTLDKSTCLERFCAMNAKYGKYGPRHGDCDADHDEAALRWSWWGCQLTTWTCCVALSRVMSGFIAIASFSVLRNSENVVLAIARGITDWDVSCAVKQWVVAGALRVTLDVGQIALIDIFNRLDTHYRAAYHRL
jgi:hypothetical protein